MTISGNVKIFGIASLGGSDGFGGHVASNSDITLSGSALVNGNATPGPGHSVSMSGSQSQVMGSTVPADYSVPCDGGDVSSWVIFAQANNSNGNILPQFLDSSGNLKITGNNTCLLPQGIYLVSSLTMNGNARLVISGKVSIVVTGAVSISGGATLNPGGSPLDLLLVGASESAGSLVGDAKGNLTVFAPLSQVTVSGKVAGVGNIWGKRVTMSGNVVWRRIVEAGVEPSGNP